MSNSFRKDPLKSSKWASMLRSILLEKCELEGDLSQGHQPCWCPINILKITLEWLCEKKNQFVHSDSQYICRAPKGVTLLQMSMAPDRPDTCRYHAPEIARAPFKINSKWVYREASCAF